MNCIYLFVALISLNLSLMIVYVNKHQLDEFQECFLKNSCFGDDLCKDIDEIQLRFHSLTDYINTVFGVKNVYRGVYLNESVFIKKSVEENVKSAPKISRNAVIDLLIANNEQPQNFLACDLKAANKFIDEIANLGLNLTQIFYLIKDHAEPLLLKLFNKENDWPVPKFRGFCGRLSVVNDCGKTLNDFATSSWQIRAHLAYQLLESALNFTFSHEKFILYLTDVSSDNIVVNNELQITFVDLENAILNTKSDLNGTIHQTEHFLDEFAFSPKEICETPVSDHNIYAICRLLLSTNSPWPMITGGLLHSPPSNILNNYEELNEYIELCVTGTDTLNRFDLAKRIMNILKIVIGI